MWTWTSWLLLYFKEKTTGRLNKDLCWSCVWEMTFCFFCRDLFVSFGIYNWHQNSSCQTHESVETQTVLNVVGQEWNSRYFLLTLNARYEDLQEYRLSIRTHQIRWTRSTYLWLMKEKKTKSILFEDSITSRNFKGKRIAIHESWIFEHFYLIIYSISDRLLISNKSSKGLTIPSIIIDKRFHFFKIHWLNKGDFFFCPVLNPWKSSSKGCNKCSLEHWRKFHDRNITIDNWLPVVAL